MACNFTIPVQGEPDELYRAARAAILKQGGSVDGTSHHGSATMPTPVGDVAIDYTLVSAGLQVVVTDKPFLVSCQQIEDGMRKAIAQAPLPRARAPAPVIDVVGETTEPTPERTPHRVIEIPVTHIEGRVPKPAPFALYVGVAAALGVTAWWLTQRQPKRRYRRVRA